MNSDIAPNHDYEILTDGGIKITAKDHPTDAYKRSIQVTDYRDGEGVNICVYLARASHYDGGKSAGITLDVASAVRLRNTLDRLVGFRIEEEFL